MHGDKVLLSVERRPVTKGFGLETLAPETFRNGVKVNEYMQTSLPNVYACGDITASPYWRIRQLARRRWPWIISWANRAR